MRLPRAKNVLHFGTKCSKLGLFWGSAPDPAGGAHDAPPDPLIVRGFEPSAIAASRLWRLQLPRLSSNAGHVQSIDFLKICPAEGKGVRLRWTHVDRGRGSSPLWTSTQKI